MEGVDILKSITCINCQTDPQKLKDFTFLFFVVQKKYATLVFHVWFKAYILLKMCLNLWTRLSSPAT